MTGHSDTDSIGHTERNPRLPWHALATPAILAAIALPIILSGNMNGRGAGDQFKYHAKVIQTFTEQLPRPNLSDYFSATTPGYHLILAAVARLGLNSDEPAHVALRLVSLLFSLALVSLFAWAVGRRTDPFTAVCLSLPLCLSLYVVNSAAWLLPDNLGWLGVLLILLIALRDRHIWPSFALAGLSLLLLVLVRQIHLWTAAVLWVSAWLASALPRDHQPTFLPPLDRPQRRFLGAVPMLVATIPAFLALLCFYRLWGNHLTPPAFADYHTRAVNPAAPAFVLALLGLAGAFYLPLLWPIIRDSLRQSPPTLVIAATIGLLIAAIPETSFSHEHGRWSGLWNLVEKVPAPLERSPLIIALAVAGAVIVVAWASAIPTRRRWVYLASLVSFAVAAGANIQLWQRYVEPFILILTAMMAADVIGKRERVPPLFRLGPLVLTLALASITALKLATEKPVIDRADPPSAPSAAPGSIAHFASRSCSRSACGTRSLQPEPHRPRTQNLELRNHHKLPQHINAARRHSPAKLLPR